MTLTTAQAEVLSRISRGEWPAASRTIEALTTRGLVTLTAEGRPLLTEAGLVTR